MNAVEPAFFDVLNAEIEKTGKSADVCRNICRKLFLFTHGLAATQIVSPAYTEEEISALISEVYHSLLADS